MRCWWRHWALDPAAAADAEAGADADAHTASGVDTAASDSSISPMQHARQPHETPMQHAARMAAHRAHVERMMGSGWSGRVRSDWGASLAALAAAWGVHGPFDGLLGFSNGAAAAFLLAAHAAAHAGRFPGLRFVVLAGGYAPEPLHLLLPPELVCPDSSSSGVVVVGGGGSGAGGAAGAGRSTQGAAGAAAPQPVLSKPLPFASLHIAGQSDPVTDVEDSLRLAERFAEGGRQLLLHDGGHCVPQQARHCSAVVEFVAAVAGGSTSGGGGSGRGGAAVAAGDSKQSGGHHHHQQQQQQQQQDRQRDRQHRKPQQPAFNSTPSLAAAGAQPSNHHHHHQQQQHQTQPQQPSIGIRKRGVSAADAVAPFEPTEEQQEEIEALEVSVCEAVACCFCLNAVCLGMFDPAQLLCATKPLAQPPAISACKPAQPHLNTLRTLHHPLPGYLHVGVQPARHQAPTILHPAERAWSSG